MTNNLHLFKHPQKWKSTLTLQRNQSQWRHNRDPIIMINPDMALAYPITLGLPPAGISGERKQSCRPGNTGNSTYGCKNPKRTAAPITLRLVYAYAADNNLFLQAFSTAFTKMAALGYGTVSSGAADGTISSGKLGTLTVLDLGSCPLLN